MILRTEGYVWFFTQSLCWWRHFNTLLHNTFFHFEWFLFLVLWGKNIEKGVFLFLCMFFLIIQLRIKYVYDRNSLEEGMAAHSSILAWRIPWTEEPEGATVHGVTESWTWLKWLSTHAHMITTSKRILIISFIKNNLMTIGQFLICAVKAFQSSYNWQCLNVIVVCFLNMCSLFAFWFMNILSKHTVVRN